MILPLKNSTLLDHGICLFFETLKKWKNLRNKV